MLKSNCTFRGDKKRHLLDGGGTEVYNEVKLYLFNRFIGGMEEFKLVILFLLILTKYWHWQ